MSKKPKVRFGVSADGKIREIFSVKKGATNQSLTLARRTPRALREGGIEFAFKEQHFSIHNSQRSSPSGTTITQKSICEGRTKSRAAFIADTSKYLFFHVYSATTGYMQPDTNLLCRGAKDIAIVFPYDFEQDRTTVIYSVYVTLKDFSIRMLPGASKTAWDSDLYRLHVLYSFIPIATPELGVSQFINTSPPLTDGVPDEKSFARAAGRSLTIDEFPLFHVARLEGIATAVVKSTIKKWEERGLNPAPEIFDVLMKLSRRFSPVPIRVNPIKTE